MTSWKKEEIEIAGGTKVLAQMPVIVSASRSTDIPAFYSDWFMERLNAGYVKWFNPFNGVPLYVGKGGVNAREFTPDEMCTVAQRIGAGHVFDAERRKVVQTFRPRFHSPRRFAILVSAMLRQSFTDFIFATNTDGSGKAASYVRALDMLGPTHYPKPIVGGSMWHSFSLADIHAVLTHVPWMLCMLIIDKYHSQIEKALCYVRRTVHNGWSHDVLRNWLSTDLYEREGKEQTNFAHRVRISSSMCEIPGSADHTGLLKVGAMSFKSTKKAFELTVNCAELKAAAKKRIDQQSGTAGIKYILRRVAGRAFRRVTLPIRNVAINSWQVR